MSLHNRAISRIAGLLTALLALTAFAACSFAPAYGPGAAERYDLAFASPTSRLEQVVYQELVARFGRSSDPNALQVQVSVSSNSLRPGQRSVGLSGTVTLVRPDPAGLTTGQVIYQAERTVSASYETSSQALANQQAANEAAERAARQLAETIRLTLLGVLAEMQRNGTLDAPYVAPATTATDSVEVPPAIAFQ